MGDVFVAEDRGELRCGADGRVLPRRRQAEHHVGDELLCDQHRGTPREPESAAAQRHTRDCQERAQGEAGRESGSGAAGREVGQCGERNGEPAEGEGARKPGGSARLP